MARVSAGSCPNLPINARLGQKGGVKAFPSGNVAIVGVEMLKYHATLEISGMRHKEK
jgi:hypothetical protein